MGSVQDSTFTFLWILVFGVGAVIAVLFFNQLTSAIVPAFGAVPAAQNTFTEFNTFLPGFFGWAFGIILIALPLMGLGLALLVPINNFWWWVFSALSILLLGIAYMLQSWIGWFLAVQLINDAAVQITPLYFVFNNFLLYSVLVIGIIGIGTYVKMGRQPQFIPGGFQ